MPQLEYKQNGLNFTAYST